MQRLWWKYLKIVYFDAANAALLETPEIQQSNDPAQHPAKPGDTKHPDRPWETSGRQVSLITGSQVETCGRQVWNHAARALRAPITGRQVGDKPEITRPEHWEHRELTGRQVGDKPEITRPEHWEHRELTGRQLGDKWETNGRQVWNHAARALRASRAYWETSGRQGWNHAARNTSPETNSKSSGPSTHPFKRSKNPSQVNLFGEKSQTETYWKD